MIGMCLLLFLTTTTVTANCVLKVSVADHLITLSQFQGLRLRVTVVVKNRELRRMWKEEAVFYFKV
jgi:hypothetical protein